MSPRELGLRGVQQSLQFDRSQASISTQAHLRLDRGAILAITDEDQGALNRRLVPGAHGQVGSFLLPELSEPDDAQRRGLIAKALAFLGLVDAVWNHDKAGGLEARPYELASRVYLNGPKSGRV